MTPGTKSAAAVEEVGPAARATTLVIGPGWLGAAIAAASARPDARVLTLSRGTSSGSHEALRGDDHDRPRTTALRGDITAADTGAGMDSLLAAAPAGVEHVVLCVSPSRARGDSHAALYPKAARGAVRLAEGLGARTLLYTSSTGVYGRTDGAVVREDDCIVPGDERQCALLEAEQAILAVRAGQQWQPIVLRVAGLYGPGRDPAHRLRSTAASERWSNFAWRDDVVSAVLHLQTRAPGQEDPALFNCADGHPVLERHVSHALRRLDVARDASTHAAPVTAPAPGAAASPRSSQRVSVDRLLATGWTPSVPTVFDGLAILGHPVTRL
jgi:nucleoside-diphosphate-sugar epimerase